MAEKDSAFREEASLLPAKKGDPDAFFRILRWAEPILGGIVSAQSYPEALREDLLQEGRIGLYKAVLLFDPALSSFPTFARLCMRSAVSDGLRRYCKEPPALSADEPSVTVTDDGTGDPQRILVGKEELARVLRQIDTVFSPWERSVFGLCLSGLGAEEIAQRMGKSRRSVENAIYRCRKKLADLS